MDAQTRPPVLAKPRGRGFAQAPTAIIFFVIKRSERKNPTSAVQISTLLRGQRQFGDITRERIRRGTFRSVPALIAAIEDYLRHYNTAPKRFVWTKSADMILDKIARCPKVANA